MDNRYKNELCVNCGTDLEWWVNTKNKKIYIDEADQLYCSKKCVREYQKRESVREATHLFKGE